jgi:hypothetical protein
MNMPESIRIGHLRIRLVESDQLVVEHSVRDRGDYVGYSSPSAQLIAVGTKSIKMGTPLGEDYKRETVVHEVLHLCLRVTDCDPDRDAKANLEDVEERAVAAISGPLLGVLRDNPALVEWLADAG